MHIMWKMQNTIFRIGRILIKASIRLSITNEMLSMIRMHIKEKVRISHHTRSVHVTFHSHGNGCVLLQESHPWDRLFGLASIHMKWPYGESHVPTHQFYIWLKPFCLLHKSNVYSPTAHSPPAIRVLPIVSVFFCSVCSFDALLMLSSSFDKIIHYVLYCIYVDRS